MALAEAYPLSWPVGRPRTERSKRRPAQFRSSGNSVSIAVSVKRLIDEVSAFTRAGKPWVINPETVVVSTNIQTRGVVPYSSAREPDDPGVAVYFKIGETPHCVSCDKWTRVADNIAAIAKHLEAMRGMERWGVADVRTAFSGFKSLPEPIITDAPMTEEEANQFISSVAGFERKQTILSADAFQAAYRMAARKLHPDGGGGSESDWMKLQRAKDFFHRKFSIR